MKIEVSHRLVVGVALPGLLHPLRGQKAEQSHWDHALPAQCTASLHGNAKISDQVASAAPEPEPPAQGLRVVLLDAVKGQQRRR